MRLLWFLAVPAFIPAMPASAQRTELARGENDSPYENDVQEEMRRVSPIARRQCLNDTQPKYARFEERQTLYERARQLAIRLRVTSDEDLAVEEAGLRRRIALAEARGDNREDMRPNALGDMLESLATIRHQRENRADGHGRVLASTDNERYSRDSERRYYNDALLACLEFRDRYPNRNWCDPSPAPGYAKCESEGPKDWDTLPDATSAEEDRPLPDRRRRPPWERASDDPALAPSKDTGIDTTGWSGTYQDRNARYEVRGSPGGMISISYKAIRPDLNQSGAVTCQLVAGRAECTGGGNYEDSDKSISYDEAWSVTLSGTTISGTWQLPRATPSWRVSASYTPALHTGASGSLSIEKVR